MKKLWFAIASIAVVGLAGCGGVENSNLKSVCSLTKSECIVMETAAKGISYEPFITILDGDTDTIVESYTAIALNEADGYTHYTKLSSEVDIQGVKLNRVLITFSKTNNGTELLYSNIFMFSEKVNAKNKGIIVDIEFDDNSKKKPKGVAIRDNAQPFAPSPPAITPTH